MFIEYDTNIIWNGIDYHKMLSLWLLVFTEYYKMIIGYSYDHSHIIKNECTGMVFS